MFPTQCLHLKGSYFSCIVSNSLELGLLVASLGA